MLHGLHEWHWCKSWSREVREFTLQKELKAQREKIQREREALQRQMDLFEQQKREHELEQQSRERSESPAPAAAAAIIRTHRRAGSNDLQLSRDVESHFEPMPSAQSSSLKEALNKSRTRTTNANTPTTTTHNQLPMFLSNSDTKSGSVLQKLPFKIASKSSSSSSGIVVAASGSKSSKLTPSGASQSSVTSSTQQSKIAEQSKLTHTRSQSSLPGARQQTPVANMLPLKLAEGKGGVRPASATTKKSTSRSEQEKFV